MYPKLSHVGDDIGTGEPCKQHDDGEDDEVHQHLFRSLSNLGVQPLENVHFRGGFFGSSIVHGFIKSCPKRRQVAR